MKKQAALIATAFGLVASAIALNEDFQSQIITTTNSPLTIIVPDQAYLRIHSFTQNGGIQRGVVTSVAGTPTPSPTPMPSPTPTPTLSTTAGPGVALSSGDPLTDTATLFGATNPTGTVTFTLTAPDGSQTPINTVMVTGDGNYNSAGVTPTETGIYLWSASYSGDINNAPATDDGENESETVTATPTPTPSPTPTPTPVPIPGVVLTATIVGPDTSTASEFIKGVTISGPSTVTVTRGDTDCFITYRKRAEATPTPAE